MTTYTDTIGTGGSFATLTLWHSTSASVPVSGDVMDVEFLSGTHDIGGTYNSFTATDLTINLKAHTSALHDGEWDGPVQINWSTRPEWYFDDQTINLNLNDLVIKMTSNNFFLWEHIGTSGSSAGYDSNLTFNRCLISNWSQDYAFISVSYVSLFDGPAASPTAYGTFKWEMNNCVVEQQNAARNLLFNSDTGVTNPYYAQKRYFNGCTFKNVSFGDRSTDNGPLDVQVSGCMNDSGTTRLVPIITASPYTATVTDYITGETTSNAQFGLWATGTNTNVSTAASFNYDGTVTAGEVCFVGPSGPEGNYRLVADADNLAVQYIDTSKPSFIGRRDIAGEPRPGLTDAGAYQSITNTVSSFEIGSSAAGHYKDGAYATVALWYATEKTSVQNGDIINLEFLSGAPHPIGGPSYDAFNEVNFDLNFKPASSVSHNGNWDEGAVADLNTGNCFLYFGDQSVSVKFEDLIVSTTGNSTIYLRNSNATSGSCGAYSLDFTYSKCLLAYNRTALTTNFGAETRDSLGNLTEVGNYIFTLENSVVDSPDNYFTNFGALQDMESNVTFNMIGSTIMRRAGSQGYGLTNASTNSTSGVNSTLTYNYKGVISDIPLVNFNITRYNLQNKIYNFTDSIFFSENVSATTIPSRVGTYNYSNYTDIRPVANYDGTVTSGQVNFVDNGSVTALRDFRLIADLDNLPVEYMDLSSFSEQEDIAGRRRPGLTNPGPYQMYDDSVISATIGSGVDGVSANYATLAILKSTIADDILNGQTLEAVLQNQSHHFNIQTFGSNALKEVDQNWIVRNEDTQDGLWDNGARFTSDYNHNIFNAILRHAFSLELRDIVINNTTTNSQIKFGQAVSGSIHDTELFINRCLVNTHADFHYAYPTLVSVRDGEYNTHTLKIFDSVITGPPSGNTRFLDSYYFSQGGGNDFAALGNHNVHIKGSTIFNRLIGRGNFTSPTSNNTVKVEGTLFGLFVPNSTTLFYRNNLIDSLTINDTLISNSSSREAGLTGSINNVEFDTDFYFDNQSRNDAVTFIGSALDPDGPLDFRLVADLDNLAVKYMTSGELSYKDITGYKRPGGTDQRDAGAFQSISDQTLINKIGTSSVDFNPDYASMSLWNSNEFSNLNVLNGTTHVLQLKSGEKHNNNLFRIGMDSGDRNVNQSFILSGQNPHNGNWDNAANLDIEPNAHTMSIITGKNSFDFKYKDLVVNASSVTSTQPRLLSHTTGVANEGVRAPEHHFIYENFMVHYPKTSRQFILVMNNNYEIITDEDLNVIERGESRSTHKNCLYIGASAGGTNSAGSICLYAHQSGTQASAVFDLQGCTIINSFLSNGRHGVQNDQLKVSAIGCLYYASPTHLDQFGRQLTLIGPYALAAGQDIDQNIKASKNVKVFDCIFNNGAGDSIGAVSFQDRYSTWVIEPLPSEYNDSTSATVEFYEPWNIWASSLSGTTFRTSYNFDGTTSPSTVSFVSSATKDYRLVASEDNLASGFVSSFDLSGLDLAGNSRGDSPYDAGAFAITPQQVEDFIRSLGGPLVLQVGYRISNNRQRLNVGGGDPEE